MLKSLARMEHSDGGDLTNGVTTSQVSTAEGSSAHQQTGELPLTPTLVATVWNDKNYSISVSYVID